MRLTLGALFCLLFLLAPAAAEDEKKEEPKKPAQETTEAERAAGLERARELDAQVVKLYGQRRYAEATPIARDVVRLREELLGADALEVAPALNNLATLLGKQGEFKKAHSLYERSLKILTSIQGSEHPDVAITSDLLGTLYFGQREFAQARMHYRRALDIRETVHGTNDPRVARSLYFLSNAFNAAGKYRESRALLERALSINQKAFGAEHPQVAQSLSNLAGVLMTLGALDDSRKNYEQALQIREKLHGDRHPTVAACVHGLAEVALRQGRYDDAQEHYERSLRLHREIFGSKHPFVAVGLNGLARVLLHQGAFDEARRHAERAVEMCLRTVGPEHRRTSASRNTLFSILYTQGAYEEARPVVEQVVEIQERTLGDEHPSLATSLSNLAALHQTMGAHKEAQRFHERALGIREEALGTAHPSVAASLHNLAMALQAQGAYDDARAAQGRAVEIWEAASGQDHPNVAVGLMALALIDRLRGAHEKAQPLLERALRILDTAFGSEHPDVAMALIGLARVEGNLGLHEKALKHTIRAQRIQEDALGSMHPAVTATQMDRASLLRLLGQHDQAAAIGSKALTTAERRTRGSLLHLQGSSRLSLMRTLRAYLANWLQIARERSEPGYLEALRLKGLSARIDASQRRLVRTSDSAVRQRSTALTAAERRLAKLASSPPSFRDKKKKAAWQKAYAKAATEREELALALQRDFAPLRQGLERLDLGLPEIQARLGEHDVLLDFLRSGDEYIAWIVRPKREAKRIDLGNADKVEEAAATFTEAAADSDDVEWAKAGKALHDLVFAPIAKHLPKDTKTIHLCPDAALAAVPFGALPSKNGVLNDQYLISTISMAQELVPWPDAPKPGQGALLLGGVDYGEASVGEKEAKAEAAFADRAPRGRKFMYLPGTKAEAGTIKSSIGGTSTVLLAKDATENRLRMASKGKRILHLATHGFVRDDLMRGLTRRQKDREWLGAGMERQLAQGHDPMLLAGLAMAGANPRKGGHGDDGILTALEASHLNLDGCELVVLSACQTALGKAESGEGVIGLVQGFQMAGAKQVIGSLWKVDDDATKALMVKFYELWSPVKAKGIGAAKALRKAQNYVRSQKKWAHPYYWAAWVLWERK